MQFKASALGLFLRPHLMVSLPITAALISTTMIVTSAYGGERYEAGQYYTSGGSYRAYARVADVVPIVRRRLTATPAQTCRWVRIGLDRNRWHRDRLSRGPIVQRCHTVSHNRVAEDVDGYRVTYRYNGETFIKIMDTHPGNRVPISVSVIPFDE